VSTGPGMGTVAAVRWEDAADPGELWEGDVLDVEIAGEHVLLVRHLYTYPVEVTGDRIRVGIPQDGLRHYNRGQSA
jgi:hypothetical protein